MPETLVCLRETQVREPPGEILLIPFGKVEYTKDNKVGSFNFDSESAQKILAEFSERGRDLVIDYEHQTLRMTKTCSCARSSSTGPTRAAKHSRVSRT